MSKIEVPLLSAGNWGAAGLHLRGNTEGFVRSASKDKWLRMHTGSHIGPFYTKEGRLDQMRFFDHWLKEIDNGLLDEPRVKLAIRHSPEPDVWRTEDDWPIPRTAWTEYYLDGANGSLGPTKPSGQASVSYSAEGPWEADRGAMFETAPLADELEITGPISLVIWVSSSVDDMDVFVVLHNIAPDGTEIRYADAHDDIISPVTRGFLRASHRKLDPEKSLPYRPYHPHDTVEPLEPGEPVRLDVEVWPTCWVFKKGHRLRLDIQPWDESKEVNFYHDNSEYWRGEHTIHTGGDYATHILLPIIP